MNARYNFRLLIIAVVMASAPWPTLGQVPTLWSKCHTAAFNNYAISWRAVEEVILGASNQEIAGFVAWTPDRQVISGDNEDVFVFIWARLDDRGEADIRQLDSKRLPWSDSASPGLIKLRITGDHNLLLRFFRSIESDGHPDPFDMGVIRCLGLVPLRYADETIAELRKYCHDASPVMKKYCDQSSTKPEATGIYGEEMLEIQDMLEYRKTGVLSSVSR